MQAGGEGRLAGTTSANEADEKFIGVLEQDFAVKVEQATTEGGGSGSVSQLRGQRLEYKDGRPGCGSQLRGQRPAPRVECAEELLRNAAPTLAEGVDLVAEVGNRGSAVWGEGAGGAASVCGTGRGRRTIPVEAVEVKGFLAGTVECAERSACREDSMRSSPAGTDASLMQAVAEGSFAGTTLTKEADERCGSSRQHQRTVEEDGRIFKREHICAAAQCNLVQPGGPAHLYGRQPAWPAGQQQALLERLRAYEAACRAARKKTAAPQEQPGVSFNLQPRANLVKGDGELQDKAPPYSQPKATGASGGGEVQRRFPREADHIGAKGGRAGRESQLGGLCWPPSVAQHHEEEAGVLHDIPGRFQETVAGSRGALHDIPGRSQETVAGPRGALYDIPGSFQETVAGPRGSSEVLRTPEPPNCLEPAAAGTGATTPVREARPTAAAALAKCFFVFGEEQPLVRPNLQSQAGWFKGESEMQPLGVANLLPQTKELVGNGGRQSAALTNLQSQLKRYRSSGKSYCEALPCDLMEPILGEEGLRTGAVRIIGGTVQNKKPEHAVHNVVKFKCEALPCDLKDPFSKDEGPHTESARRFGGTVEGEVPEDLFYSTGKSICEALPCDLMEPILEEEGLCTNAESFTGGTVQCKEPGCTVLAKFDGVALPWNSMEPISRAGGLHNGGARCIGGTLQSAVPEVALSTLIFEHLEEPVAIFSRKVGLGGSSTFEAAQVISISEHLVGAMLSYSREGGQRGSTFEAAQISPSSENRKEQLLAFSREVGLVGSFTRHGRAVGGLWAVVQAAAVVASAAVVAAEVWGSVGERWLQQQWALGPLLALFVRR
jgi:hypothetical protein